MKARTLLSVLASSWLVACTGSGDGSGQGAANDGAPGSSGGSANGLHVGTLFIGERDEGWKLDIATGEYVRIPGVGFDNDQPERVYIAGSGVQAHPQPVTGANFVVTVDGCRTGA